jgi:hypothetical protein
MQWSQLRIAIHIFILSLQFNRLWNALYPRFAEIVAYKLCFAALPSYTYCQTNACFQRQVSISNFALQNIFSEHEDFCVLLTAYEHVVLKERHFAVWQSLLQCLDSYSGRDTDMENFTELMFCPKEPPDETGMNLSATR